MDSSERSLVLQNDRVMMPEQESFPQGTVFASGRSRGAEGPTDTMSQRHELSASPTKRRRLPQQNSKIQTVRLFQGLGVSGCLLVGQNLLWSCTIFSTGGHDLPSGQPHTSIIFHLKINDRRTMLICGVEHPSLSAKPSLSIRAAVARPFPAPNAQTVARGFIWTGPSCKSCHSPSRKRRARTAPWVLVREETVDSTFRIWRAAAGQLLKVRV
jgi:hypothetical protein